MTIRPRYLIALLALDLALLLVFGIGNVKMGRIIERQERNDIIEALVVVEILRRQDSIVTEVAYTILRRRDSIIAARASECGPMMMSC